MSEHEIREHLEAILQSRRFVAAERNAKFLRFVVDKTLSGEQDEVKETVIGVEVYGRALDYDPKSDSIVRVEATRLRQRLRAYYEDEGRDSRLRIEIPSGSYVPRFERTDRQPHARFNPGLRPITVAAAVLAVAILFSLPVARGSRAIDPQPLDSEASAAWKEGLALLHEDPNTADAEAGPPRTLARAIERLEFAVARSPRFAPGWAALSEAYDYSTSFTGRDSAESARRAEAAARKAVALDDGLAAGHHMLALALKDVRWEFGQAETEYRRTLQLDPRDAYAAVELADLLWIQGRTGDADAELRKARALLPALPALASKQAEILLSRERPDSALAAAQNAIELKRDYLRAYVAAGAAYEAKGDYRSALAQYELALKADPFERRALPAYGYLLARTGQTDPARGVVKRLERMNATFRNCAFQLAVVYSGLGEDKVALDWLERAWKTRQSHFPFAAAEYRFRRFHEHPRFLELLSRVNLKPVAP